MLSERAAVRAACAGGVLLVVVAGAVLVSQQQQLRGVGDPPLQPGLTGDGGGGPVPSALQGSSSSGSGGANTSASACEPPADALRLAPQPSSRLWSNSSTGAAAPLPFGRAENRRTSPPIRLPAPGADPGSLAARPFPTSAWFLNALWPGPAGGPHTYGEDPVQLLPYHVRVRGPPSPATPGADRGLFFNMPAYAGAQGASLDVVYATFDELQLTFTGLQDAARPAIMATGWDELSLALTFDDGAGGVMATPLVKGAPYLTATFSGSGVRPLLRAPRAGRGGARISHVSQAGPAKLRVELAEVPYTGTHTWLLWAPRPIAWELSGNGSSLAVWDAAQPAARTLTGTLRVAWTPGDVAVEAVLDAHVDVVPVSGAIAAWADLGLAKALDAASYSLAWRTQRMAPGGQQAGRGQLLMLALPHQLETLVVPDAAAAGRGGAAAAFPLGTLGSPTATSFSLPAPQGGKPTTFAAFAMSIRGPLVPVASDGCWVLRERLPPLGSEVAAAANIKSKDMRAAIEKSLLADLKLVLPPDSLPRDKLFADFPFGPRSWPWGGLMQYEIYFGGIELQAAAQLLLIARALQQTSPKGPASFGPTAAAAAANLTSALQQLLLYKLSLPCTASGPGGGDYHGDAGGPNFGALCYDPVFKLLTLSRAVNAPDDTQDFSSRTGTDSHFHLGHWVFAAAAVAKEDPAFYKAHLEPYVTGLIRNYANWDAADALFPFARHKDFFEGHSWAAGLQPSADGKNQESTSEATNAYYAIALLGRALGNAALEAWGRLLMAMEIRAARAYVQVHSGRDLYRAITGSSSNPVSRDKVASILFAGKATSANWFNPDILTRHAIQWLPFSLASNELLDTAWLGESLPLILANSSLAKDGSFWVPAVRNSAPALPWRVALAMAQSMLPGQKDAAWRALNALPLDASDGRALQGYVSRLTRTGARWWVATRPE